MAKKYSMELIKQTAEREGITVANVVEIMQLNEMAERNRIARISMKLQFGDNAKIERIANWQASLEDFDDGCPL